MNFYMAYEFIVKKYLSSLQHDYKNALIGRQHTAELSFRPPMDTLFKELSVELNGNPNIVVIFEPRNQARMGRPDWRIHDSNTLGVYGYIEAKSLTANTFDISTHEEQFSRYLSLGHKLLITDGIDFAYSFDSDSQPHIISLIDKSLLRQSDWSRLPINPQFRLIMKQFFSEPTPQYCDEGTLVELVALRARHLSDEILRYSSILIEEAMDDAEKNAIAMLGGLKELVYNHNDHTLRKDKVFADFAAQVILFTLLYAHRVECSDVDSPIEKEEKIKRYLAQDIVNGQILRPFLTIIHYINCSENDGSFINMWTDECIRFLSFVHMTTQQRQRPDYHKLFELFLSKFDAQSRFDYGAYYTPFELADFIVRFTEYLTQLSFDGCSLFSDGNTLIDPCCGTGSFLERIRAQDTRHGSYNLCGIEILPAPYMLANYRMAILNGQSTKERASIKILLANTLSDCVLGEPANIDTVEGYELNRACEITSRPITLVIGNPPSSDSAKANSGEDFTRILSLMDDFRPPVENRHGRQNTQKQIKNPHLQFLRWGCKKLHSSPNHSVLAFMVPSTFLEAESYKYARKYITEHFSNAWIVSVDADARAGIRSDSLFNTQQGRAILIATRQHGSVAGFNRYMYSDISHFSRSEKISWLEQPAEIALESFSEQMVDKSNYGICPSLPFNFDQETYVSFWAISGDSEFDTIFKQHCSGIKLAPTSIFTHIKAPMLKRRSKDIAKRGVIAAKEWLGNQDKPPQAMEVNFFAEELASYGTPEAIDALLEENITDYAFRPFLSMKAFLWQDLLKKFSHVGGRGTRRRPEIYAAYNSKNTVGFALSHSPKDQKSLLRQFASFCWYYPDNDLCRRGNSYIYLNQYPLKRGRNAAIGNNINDYLSVIVAKLLGKSPKAVSSDIVFYVYAVLCSQVYLDEFEGALYTTNRSDLRPRIPFVDNPDIFSRLCALGKNVANLEKRDYTPSNRFGFDYESIKSSIPAGFRLKWNDNPFDEERELFILSDGNTQIEIPCSIEIQRISISGYDILKNVWLKFNSYNFTHCALSSADVEGLLNLMNALAEYIYFVGQIDIIMHGVVEGAYPLIRPPVEFKVNKA